MITSATGSGNIYNTYLREYNFTFPPHDVVYDAYNTVETVKMISRPSMEIIAGGFKIQDNMTATAYMTLAGTPYTNTSVQYSIYSLFYLNASTFLEINIGSNIMKKNASVIDSQASIMIHNMKYVYPPLETRNPCSPLFVGNTLIWTIDLSEVNAIIALNQIFTDHSYFIKTLPDYEQRIIFSFKVLNNPSPSIYIYDQKGNPVVSSSPPPQPLSEYQISLIVLYSIGGLMTIAIIGYSFYYNKTQKVNKGK